MIKRLKPPKNRLKIDFNLDLVVMYSEKVGTFDDIHLFLFQDIVLFCFNRNTHFSCKKGQADFHTSTLPHKIVCRFVVCLKNYSENTLPKIGDFLGVSGVDIIIYFVYIIFFRRYMLLTLFFVWKCGSVDFRFFCFIC